MAVRGLDAPVFAHRLLAITKSFENKFSEGLISTVGLQIIQDGHMAF